MIWRFFQKFYSDIGYEKMWKEVQGQEENYKGGLLIISGNIIFQQLFILGISNKKCGMELSFAYRKHKCDVQDYYFDFCLFLTIIFYGRIARKKQYMPQKACKYVQTMIIIYRTYFSQGMENQIIAVRKNFIVKFAYNLYDMHNKMQKFEQQIVDLQQTDKNEVRKLKIIKIIVMLLLGVSAIVYLFLPASQFNKQVCIDDRIHDVTDWANSLLHTSKAFRFIMIVAGQEIIDISFIALIIVYLFRIKNFWPLVWMLGFYLTRAIFLSLTKMPYPPGFIFESQGIPSFAVPYGITRDFFYSGHTGFMVFSCSIWSATKSKFMKYFMIIGTVQVIWLLLITRVHYAIDVFAGFVFSRWFTMIITRNQQSVDRFVSCLIYVLPNIFVSFFLWAKSKFKKNKHK